MKSYRQPTLKEFADQQVRFAPPPLRLEQLKRAEQLLNEIDAKKSYPFQFVYFRILDFRTDVNAGVLIPGVDLVHDLGLFIHEVADSMPAIPVEEVNEPVMTLNQMSERLNVTTK